MCARASRSSSAGRPGLLEQRKSGRARVKARGDDGPPDSASALTVGRSVHLSCTLAYPTRWLRHGCIARRPAPMPARALPAA